MCKMQRWWHIGGLNQLTAGDDVCGWLRRFLRLDNESLKDTEFHRVADRQWKRAFHSVEIGYEKAWDNTVLSRNSRKFGWSKQWKACSCMRQGPDHGRSCEVCKEIWSLPPLSQFLTVARIFTALSVKSLWEVILERDREVKQD